jgi:uncharacterized surface protein with fasciclin (FAS1) repeats
MKKYSAALAVVAALSMTAACGSDDSGSTDTGSSESSSETSETPAPDQESSAPADDAAANLVGSGCADYAKAVPDGAGSVAGMAQDPVAVAASNNPLLKTLTAAVSGQLNKDVDLVDTLNNDEFTVFAPVDDAFAALPAKTVKTLGTPAGAETLASVLTYHVVPGQIAPDQIVGEQTTVQGGTVKVTGSGDNLKVNGANVICGGVQTANATVYLIDEVMMPPAA